MVGSHCRSDQLDLPDRPNSLTKFAQLLYRTFSRPLLDRTRPPHDHSRLLHDFNPTTTPISTRSSRPLHDLYSTNSSLLDLYSNSTRTDRPGRTRAMGYWSNRGPLDRVLIGKLFYSDLTRSLNQTKLDLDRKRTFPNQLDLYLTNIRSLPDASRALGFSISTRMFWTCPTFSGRKPDRCRSR